ncbi:MAG: DUF885 domain-containing protein [Gemmatimonadota bacterium]|nr:DUF885 domain-containing protein [Gemmatimonadota bacterium]
MRAPRMGRIASFAALLVLLAAVPVRAQEAEGKTDFHARYVELAENEEMADAEKLHALFELQWERSMAWHPEFATYVGWPGGDHGAWTDNALEAIEERREQAGDPLLVLETIDREALSEEDRLNYDLFARDVRLDVEGNRFPSHLAPLNQLGGPQQDVAQLLSIQPHRTVEEYEAILSRLRGAPEVFENAVDRMEEGLEQGVTPPKVTLRDVPEQVENQIVEDPLESPMLAAFTEFPETVSEPVAERLRTEAIEIYRDEIVPALRVFHTFLVDEYIPGARESIAATELPDGEAWYAYRVRRLTTTDLTPREIHDIGLAEVERIRSEMERIVSQTAEERAADPDAPDGNDFDAFTEWLRTDPRFYFEEENELLEGYRDIAKRADPELVKLFGTLPRLPYGVEPVPDYAEKSQTTAYYRRGSPEANRAGIFFANTYALDTRPKWEMEALTLHEAVPGHHLQIAIAQELEDLPRFRRFTGPTAYVEGWGLYSESLGEEMGFYEDPYSKFGQLSYEMWRAVRLVVDTGMHAFGWDRQRAIDFFASNSAKPLHDITVEIDRYIVWPAQALAYKIGERKIKELRATATEELGDDFDVRAFHDVVLGAGAIPLEILERRVMGWIAEVKGEAAADR